MAVGSSVAMKVVSIAISIPVGIATKKVVGKVWLTARPDNPPRKPTEAGVVWSDAVAWAALTAAGVVARDLITRSASEATFRALTGLEPPPPKKTRAEKKLEKAADKIDLDEIGEDTPGVGGKDTTKAKQGRLPNKAATASTAPPRKVSTRKVQAERKAKTTLHELEKKAEHTKRDLERKARRTKRELRKKAGR